jgi:TusA-related sulfurtransferase
VGVQHTETSLIVWSGDTTREEVVDKSGITQQPREALAPVFDADRMYDAGDQGCATGPLDEIASIMREMSPGQTLEIHATDAAVSIDLEAWCRMTGNDLVEHRGYHFLIKKS